MATNATLESDRQSGMAGKYLTFTLGCESYGIPVLKVREIIKLVPITVVPQMPAYIKGVVNLRGKIIPVVDLRAKFGLTTGKDKERTCIVVVQVNTARASKLPMGLIVDAVEEVANIVATDIEPTPDFGTSVATDYLLGMAKIKGSVKALLDIDRVLSQDPITSLDSTALTSCSSQ